MQTSTTPLYHGALPAHLFSFFSLFCCLSALYLFTFWFLGRLRWLNQSEPGAAPDDPGPAGCVEGPARTTLPVHVSRCRQGRQSVADARSRHRAALCPPAGSHSGPWTPCCFSAWGNCWQVTLFQRSRPRCRTQDVWQTSTISACRDSRSHKKYQTNRFLFSCLTCCKYLYTYTIKRLNIDQKIQEGGDLGNRVRRL